MKLLDAALRRRDKRLPGDIADAVAAYAVKATWLAGFEGGVNGVNVAYIAGYVTAGVGVVIVRPA